MPAVKYDVPREATIRVANTGSAIAHWHFVSKLEDPRICRRWLSVSHTDGLLLPGEAVDITLTVRVDKKTAQLLNLGRELLDDVLVLRVENSGDFFVSVAATFLRSCYGMSLEELIYTPQPARETRLPALAAGGAKGNADLLEPPPAPQGAPKQTVPKEIWRLADAIHNGGHNGPGNALKEKNVFVSGDADAGEVAAVREALDCGLPLPVCSPHALATALLTLLGALPRPVLPPELCPSAEIEPGNMGAWCRRYLDALPPLNAALLVYLLSFLRAVLAQSDYNRATPAKLAAVFAACLLPNAADTDISKDEKNRRETRQQLMEPILVFLLTSPQL